jgi:hypothetical protein
VEKEGVGGAEFSFSESRILISKFCKKNLRSIPRLSKD